LGRVFSPENLPDIILGAAGVVGVVVAIITFKTIARQTRATEDSVKAMRDSLRIVFSKERARIESKVWRHL